MTGKKILVVLLTLVLGCSNGRLLVPIFAEEANGEIVEKSVTVKQDSEGKEAAKAKEETPEEPKLTGLDVVTKGVSITPAFNENVVFYGMDMKPEVSNVTIKVKANGKIFVTKMDKFDRVITSKTAVQDTITIDKKEMVDDFINVIISVENDKGVTKDIAISVFAWQSDEQLAKETYRSQFHVTPPNNFMNDPNGMVYDSSDGYWHLFYQQSTQNSFHNQSWGHVRSKDLVNWQQMPLALQIDQDGLIYSGCAIEDKDNTSGLFSNDPSASRLLAYYTIDTPGKWQQQALAYSTDHGLTWQKYGIIVPHTESQSGADFRDPKVFKMDNLWYMVTAGGTAQIHTSKDLLHWERSQVLTFKDGTPMYNECPMLYPTKVNGTGATKWVYGGSDAFYVVGDMQKDSSGIYKWKAESDKIDVEANTDPWAWANYGKYATMTFNQDGAGKNREIGISWLQDFNDFEGRKYRGVQSLPLEYGLKQHNGSYIITQKPVEEVNKLHDTVLYQANNKKVTSKDANILAGVSGRYYDLDATFILGSAKEFGFSLRRGKGQEILYRYDVERQKMIVDVSHAGKQNRSGVYEKTLKPNNGRINLRMLVDQGAIEAFGNEGEANVSTALFTDDDNIAMEFYTKDGDVKFDKIAIHDMKSMYSKVSGSQSKDITLAIDGPDSVKVGDTFVLSSNVYPNQYQKNFTWQYPEGFVAVQEDTSTITLKAQKSGDYPIVLKEKDGDRQITKTIHVEAGAVNKEALKDIIEKAEKIDLSKYETPGAENLKTTLGQAKEVFVSPNASQEEVDAMVQKLQAAINGLVVKNDASKPDQNKKPGKYPGKVITGDDTTIAGAVLLIILSGISIAIAVRRKNKQEV